MSEKRFRVNDLVKYDYSDILVMMMSELFEFEYNALQEMLIVNHQEGFSYNMSYEDDVFSVATKLNDQQAIINKLKEENNKIKTKLNEQDKKIRQLEKVIEDE